MPLLSFFQVESFWSMKLLLSILFSILHLLTVIVIHNVLAMA